MRFLAQFVVRHPWMALVGAVLVAGIGGFAVAASGLPPIKASSGHWAATEWFLQFAMRRSVVTHALMAPRPPDDIDAYHMVIRGAGHFETGCRPCHGAPGDSLPPIPQAMTPHPPALGPRVDSWSARQLFYIVKHGVKFTGMPAWPAQQRDDEVWAVVGFLRRLPRLTSSDYQTLVRGGGSSLAELSGEVTAGTRAPGVVADVCARCHGFDGAGRGAFPKLAGQQLEYMTRALHAYAEGRRFSGIMAPLAAGLEAEARHEALAYYAALPQTSASGSSGSPALERGQIIATRGVPDRDIPACMDCHSSASAEGYPRLSGQHGHYLAQQLRLFQQRRRGGSEFAPLMHSFVDRLTAAQIDDVTAYFEAAGGR